MHYPPPDYFQNMQLLEKLRAGDVPPCLDVELVEARLLKWILEALGQN